MQLSFPNPSRSYDERGHGVLFWGYDKTFEISFFVEEAALAKFTVEGEQDEAGVLSVFDHNVDRIREVADGVYARRRKGSKVYGYTLTGSDF